MKAVRLAELKALLEGDAYASFWSALLAARRALAEAEGHHEELETQALLTDFRAESAQKEASDVLFAAGEAEDLAQRLEAEEAQLENEGLELVSRFEEQRFIASDAWYHLGASEKSLEELRDQRAQARPEDVSKLEAEKRRREVTLAEARVHYEREDKKKTGLWEQVEMRWARSAETALIVAEKRLEARRIRARAETLFREAEERKARAKRLREETRAHEAARQEARKSAERLLESVSERFGGVAVGAFLYFRCREEQKAAWAVALIDDAGSFNVEVRARTIFRVDQLRGVAFLEPAVDRPGTDAEGDERFEAYFLHGRKGRVSTSPAGGA